MLRIFAFLLATLIATQVGAQVAPSTSEISRYKGLHKAAHDNDLATVKGLIAEGANLNLRDSYGRTPVHVAAFASNDDIVRALAKAGAEMNVLENGLYDVVTIAAVANDPEMVSLAIELGNDPGLTTSVYDGTALIAAAHLGHHQVVKRLIDAGAPLDHVNNLHWTALIEAVVLGNGGPNHIATVRALVNASADLSIGDRDGATALQHAVSRGYKEIAKIIRDAER